MTTPSPKPQPLISRPMASFELDFTKNYPLVENISLPALINGISVNPLFAYRGQDAATNMAPWGFGPTLVKSGGSVTLYEGSIYDPDRNLYLGASNYFQCADTSSGDVGTKDFLFFAVANGVTASKCLMSKRVLGNVGWTISVDASSKFTATLQDATGSVDIAGAAAAYNGLSSYGFAVNRDEASTNGGQIYYNGLPSGSGVDCSARAGSLDTSAKLTALRESGASGSSWTLGIYLIIGYAQADWFAAGATGRAQMDAWFAEMHNRLMGTYARRARGTHVPTYTRESIGPTRRKYSDGQFRYAALGSGNILAADAFDATQKCYRGLYANNSITNNALRSNQPGSSPNVLTGATATTTGQPYWAGAINKLTETAVTSKHGWANPIGSASGWYFASAVYAKGTRDYGLISIEQAAEGDATAVRLWFSLNTGAAGTLQNVAGVNVIYSIRAEGSFWIVTLAAELSSQTDWWAFYLLASADGTKSYLGVITEIMYVGFIQQGTGKRRRNYIGVSDVAATANADQIEWSGADGNIPAGQGTLVMKFLPMYLPALDADQVLMTLSAANSADNMIQVGLRSADGSAYLKIVSGGVTQANITDTGIDLVTDGLAHTIAAHWGPNYGSLDIDGAPAGTNDTSVTVPTGLDKITMGDHVGANHVGALFERIQLFDSITVHK